MLNLTIKRRWWHALIQKAAASPFGIWLLADNLHRIDKPLLKLSRNRASFTSWLAGLPVIVLHHTGAKSGLPRQTPLVVHTEGEKIILIASYFGAARNPAWYHNLVSCPEVEVAYQGEKAAYRARKVNGDERPRYWDMAVGSYPGYARYEQRAGERVIPVMVLEPV